MVHLLPLPGAPGYRKSLEEVIDQASRDTRTLTEAGFAGLMVENFGDTPFYPDRVPPLTVAAMAKVMTELIPLTPLPWGVNVLRNDAETALSVAAVVGAGWIRVNVWAGLMVSDQGPLVGRAAELSRFRHQQCPEVAVLADVLVKHSVPPPGLTLTQNASDLWERGEVDGLIITGSGTGQPVSTDSIREIRGAVPEAAIWAGSGVDPQNLSGLSPWVNGIIVGTALKKGGRVIHPVDPELAENMVQAAQAATWFRP